MTASTDEPLTSSKLTRPDWFPGAPPTTPAESGDDTLISSGLRGKTPQTPRDQNKDVPPESPPQESGSPTGDQALEQGGGQDPDQTLVSKQDTGWWQRIKSVSDLAKAETGPTAESTGVLTGLTGWLPAEKMVTTIPALEPQPTNGRAEVVLEAARSFYEIATQVPQPVAVPRFLSERRRHIISTLTRGILFLAFIILVALPLPGVQKLIDPNASPTAPRTEPGGELGEELGNRRRQLISEQLGIIDLQQPGAVALVSFDFATSTQGEMQPLAEAIMGRLRGQGMKIILVSLEPEGAALAQKVTDAVLQEREETYGVDVVNLGYLPGQVVAVRELVTGRQPLDTIKDFMDGQALKDRPGWGGLHNLSQVDLVVTLADNPATARWWIEQMALAIPPDSGERFMLAATSAAAEPFLEPYRQNNQLNGLIAGVNGAAAIEASRQQFGPARQMLDSQSLAHLLIIFLIAAGTVAGWMPTLTAANQPKPEETP